MSGKVVVRMTLSAFTQVPRVVFLRYPLVFYDEIVLWGFVTEQKWIFRLFISKSFDLLGLYGCKGCISSSSRQLGICGKSCK